MLASFTDVTTSWDVLQQRSDSRVDTRIAGPVSLSVSATSTVEITLVNEGEAPLAQFADWDVIFEVLTTSDLGLAYLTYTSNPAPVASQWTVQGIYLNAASSTPEVGDPGVFNPGEEMIVLVNPSPFVRGNTYERVTFVTPNGVSAKVIFEVLPPTVYVVDATDRIVYKYDVQGTLLGSSPLDSQNGSAGGITTRVAGVWTTDVEDDLVYEYTAGFAPVTSWAQAATNTSSGGVTTHGTNIWVVEHKGSKKVFKYTLTGSSVSDFSLVEANDHATGITTNGSNIWVVDHKDLVAYKYDMTGNLVSSFPLAGGQSNPRGITTDGGNIWVADEGTGRVYMYTMTGAYVSDFALTGANADPHGITVTPR